MNTHTHAISLALLIAARASGADFCASVLTVIPDNNETGVIVPIEVDVSAAEQVTAITLDLTVIHPWVGDLVVTLESPSGTLITLLDRPGIPNAGGFPGPFGCGGRDIDATFSDSASATAEDMCSYAAQPVIAGPVLPSQPLSVLAGEPAPGTWLLRLRDASAHDQGTIGAACLHITTQIPCPADLNADAQLNFFDVSAFLGAFQSQGPAADFTGDGEYNFFDVSAFLAAYGAGCP